MATRKKNKIAARKQPKHRESADEQAATELVLYIENTSDLSPDGPSGQGRSVLLNALRKWKRGTYDPEKAVKLFEYLTEAGAKRYAIEMGSSPKEWSTMFNPATRHEAAKQLEASFRSSVKNGEYDHVDTRIGGPREVDARRRREPYDSSSVTYPSSPSGQYILRRDGQEVIRGSEQEIWQYIHRNHSYSINHALRYEGYSIAPVEGLSEVRGASFTPSLSGDYVGRRVEIVRVARQRPSSYFKAGQFAYVVGQNTTGGMSLMDVDRDSAPGEVALLIAKTREMRGGALWFSLEGVRFTGKAREAQETVSERKYSMTYGVLPPFEQFEHDVHTRIDPDYTDGRPYWPQGMLFPLELVSSHEIELAETFGLEEFEVERQRTGRNTRVRGFRDNEKAIYEFLEFLTDRWNNGDEEAGDLASSIMFTLGYEWI